MRTTRRRNRLRSAQYATERWKPSATFVVLAVGLIFGAALGLRNRLSDQSSSVQQHYMLLVSDLYAQGVPLTSVRDRLISLGYANPSVAVLGVADQLARAQDSVSQQEADQLHQFAEALVAGPDGEATVQARNTAVPTAGVSPTAPSASTPVPAIIDAPTSTVTPVPTSEALVTASPETNSAPVPAAPPTPRPPTPTPVPKATAAPEKSGIVHTAGHQPALLRAAPTSKSTAVAIVPDNAKVAVYGIARGEALEPGENRWYHVVYNGRPGYLYYKLVQLGG